MMKVSIFLFLAAWLLTGCASAGSGKRKGGLPTDYASEGDVSSAQRTAQPAQNNAGAIDRPADNPGDNAASQTPASSPTVPAVLENTPFPAALTSATPPTPFETRSDQTGKPQPTLSPTSRPSLAPGEWKSWPVVPAISQTARDIYRRGQVLGRDPRHFSKVGDCQNITTYFLSHFENTDLYRLGDYASLQPAIDWFMGSFARESLAVKGGMNVAAVLSPLRANPQFCSKEESPLACEYRLDNPSFAIISMEEAWSGEPEKYGKYMRQVIEFTIQQGIVPVIATKADDLEGGDRINAIIAGLAWEYDIPLWNFWAAVQPLYGHGLGEDGFHLTHGNNFFFDVPESQRTGYTLRNLTALQVIDALWRGLSDR